MPLALEMLIVPVLLLTIIAVVVIAELGPGAALAGTVGLGILYFVFVTVLRTARREEREAGDDQGTHDENPDD